jgi:hypothetical protein
MAGRGAYAVMAVRMGHVAAPTYMTEDMMANMGAHACMPVGLGHVAALMQMNQDRWQTGMQADADAHRTYPVHRAAGANQNADMQNKQHESKQPPLPPGHFSRRIAVKAPARQSKAELTREKRPWAKRTKGEQHRPETQERH